jgi:hypothetical protein
MDLQVCLSHEETKPDLIGEFPSIVTSFVPGVVFGRFLDSFVLPFFDASSNQSQSKSLSCQIPHSLAQPS